MQIQLQTVLKVYFLIGLIHRKNTHGNPSINDNALPALLVYFIIELAYLYNVEFYCEKFDK